MRYLVRITLILVILIGLWAVVAMATANHGFLALARTVLEQFAALDYRLHQYLWQMTPPTLRAFLGVLKCLKLLLTLLGMCVLWLLVRLVERDLESAEGH